MSTNSHPETDESDLLDENDHSTYQHLIRILECLCTIGRTDIQFPVCFLSRFSACPHKEQLKAVGNVFGYLKDFPDRWTKFDHWDLKVLPMLPTPDVSFKELYPDVFEELDKRFLILFGPAIQSSIFFDSDHAHDLKTKRSCTRIIIYVGSTPVSWSSKRQTSIQTSSYGAEFMAGKTAHEGVISIRYMLWCLGVWVKGPTNLYGDNQLTLQSSTLIDSECKKKHIPIAYHKMQECVAARIVNPVKVDTKKNLSDSPTKRYNVEDPPFSEWCVLWTVDVGR